MNKIMISMILPALLYGAAPVLTFVDTVITTTTGTSESSGAGNTAVIGTDATASPTVAAADNYTATPLDDTIYYIPSTVVQTDIFGDTGDDKIIPTDKEIEDYYGQYYGEEGNDYIELSWGGSSEAYGGAGDDTLMGYRGTQDTDYQYFYGGAGDDKIYVPENFSGTRTRIFGDAGFDIMIVFGLSSEYEVTKRWGRYYLKKLSTGGTLQFKTIEKIVFTTDTTPNIAGADVGEVFYFDNSTTLSTTPTAISNAALTTITLYEHRFSFYSDFIATTGFVGSVYINNISDKMFQITDTTTAVSGDIYSRDVKDNADNILGQIGWVKIPISADGTRELILTGEEQATAAELAEITTTMIINSGF